MSLWPTVAAIVVFDLIASPGWAHTVVVGALLAWLVHAGHVGNAAMRFRVTPWGWLG